ncbi:MAG: hypothetical protein O0V67_07860, partial [Methanocorpusculum sp.]|nr:hypothetical protein [Methanocorpusculum sp.]
MIDVTQTLQNYEERISNLEHENAELKNMLDLESADTGLHELLDRMKIIERDQNLLYEKFSALALEFQARKEKLSTSP